MVLQQAVYMSIATTWWCWVRIPEIETAIINCAVTIATVPPGLMR